MTVALSQVLQSIAARADAADQSANWPVEDLAQLASAGAMRWAISRELGGDGLLPLELHQRYEQLAVASLSTALILTQRDSAAQILASSSNLPLRQKLLPGLLDHSLFATVGIAQLTTSRQGGLPALVARRVGASWRLTGLVPWCTGAAFAGRVIVGAAVQGSNDQILCAMPTDLPGLQIDSPLPLVALRSTHTASMKLQEVEIEDADIVKGPSENVLSGRQHVLPAGQAFLALGLCRGAIDLISRHDSKLARDSAARFRVELEQLSGDLLLISDLSHPPPPQTVARVRGRCNELAVRITHAAIAIYKGSALLAGHPAQRLAREAMFLLVWSCPNPVIDCTVDMLAGSSG
jgi:alkylation response protein AidB-like acyl-CoA dehydrogenase